jgi:peptidoglycan/LPS O-acetylase OafA/YrhL
MYTYEAALPRDGQGVEYLIKRICRIAPLFWFMQIVYIIHPFSPSHHTLSVLLINFLFVFNFFPSYWESIVSAGWTIGVEMPFYLIFPALLAWWEWRRQYQIRDGLILFFASFAVSIIFRTWALKHIDFNFDYPDAALPTHFFEFVGGMVTYKIVRLSLNRDALWVAVGLAGVALLLTIPLNIDPLYWIPGRQHILTWTLGFCMVCAWQAVKPSLVLSCRPMQWLGERSFSIYLLHPFTIYVLIRHGAYQALYHHLHILGAWAYLPCVMLTAAIVLPTAALTYRMIETPGQIFGKYLIAQIRVRRIKTLAVAP